MRKQFWILSAVLLCFICVQIAASQNPKLYDLGTFPGGGWSSGNGINDFGIVAAVGGTPQGTRPLIVPLYGPNAGRWTSLGTLGGEMDAGANAVANTGLVVGYAGTTDGFVHPFAWTEISGMSDLGIISEKGDLYGQATNVNGQGTLISGWSSVAYDSAGGGFCCNSPMSTAVVWTPYVAWETGKPFIKWRIHPLDETGMEQYRGWYAAAVNNNGQIVGHAWSDEGLFAFVWNPLPGGKGWKVQRLGCSQNYPFCAAVGMNDKGEIVGFGVSPDWSSHIGVLWKPVGGVHNSWTVTELASLPANPFYMGANSINNRGDIVGSGADVDGGWKATRWNDLNTGLVKLLGFPTAPSLAADVNNSGTVVGTYLSPNWCWCAVAIQIPAGTK